MLAVAGDRPAPSPRGVPSWIVRSLVDAGNGSIDISEGQDLVALSLRVPRQY